MTSKKRKTKSNPNAAERFIDKILNKLPKNKFFNVLFLIVAVFLMWAYCVVATLFMITGLLIIVAHVGYVIFGGAEFQIDAIVWGFGVLLVGLILARIFSKNIFDVIIGSFAWN